MRPLAILTLLAAALVLPLGSEAAACIWNYPLEVGKLSKAQRERARERQERYEADQRLLQRQAGARAALARGYDITGALAEILVPNIRPVPIKVSDSCGGPSELDYADGSETMADLLAGTRFAHWGPSYRDLAPPWDGETFGLACNAEFRRRFAAFLTERLSADQRQQAYLFLAARVAHWKGEPTPLQHAQPPSVMWSTVSRLVAFAERTRQLPIRWTTDSRRDSDAIEGWLRQDGSGRALQAAMDDFWNAHGADLGASERACPAATARWPSVQARIVAPLEAWVARHPSWAPPPR